MAPDRVQIDECGGPGGLQLGLPAAQVAALARPIAVREQAEQALDARARAAQVLGGVGIVERLTRGDQELLVGSEQDLPSAAAWADAALPERTAVAARLREGRAALARGLEVDRRDL